MAVDGTVRRAWARPNDQDLAMGGLADLIGRASATEEPGVERAIFDTADAGRIAGVIEDYITARCGGIDRALFYRPGVGIVVGVVLADGSRVVVKVHRWNVTRERLTAVQRVQTRVAAAGQPAPRPLLDPSPLGHGIVTVEEMIDGGRADGRQAPTRMTMARALHDLIRAAEDVDDVAALGAPLLLRPSGAPLWPEPHDVGFDFTASAPGAEWIDELALVARRRLGPARGRPVVGHFDWRVQNLGFNDGRVVAIYDWDSLCLAPEPVVVGSAAAQFTVDWSNGEPDPLPSWQDMRSFVDDYERVRGAPFTGPEREQLDAANLASCAYGARCQHSDMRLRPAVAAPAGTRWIRLLRDIARRPLMA